jgi:hypothetical protein
MIEPTPAAALLRLAVSTYWRVLESDRTERIETARIACEAYQLGNFLIYDEPDDGWDDEYLELVGANLISFADLLAISAVEWSDGAPPAARPIRELLESAFHDNGLDVWLDRALSRAKPIRDADDWIARHRNEYRFDKTVPGLEPDDELLMALRAHERHEWPPYHEYASDSAKFLQRTIDGYVSLYEALSDPEAAPAFEVIDGQRYNLVEEVAWARECIQALQLNGGAAEAILAVDLGTRLMRDGFLILSTRSQAEFADLNLLTPAEVSRLAKVNQLEEWAFSVLEGSVG